jgi:SAM-dependent methyltransferase
MSEKEAAVTGRYYDEIQERLVYIGESANAEMWDAFWAPTEEAVRTAIVNDRGTRWLVRLTQRFLSVDAGRILEGGCALGHNVAALRRAGYESVGIDFATETVIAVHAVAPDLNVFLADLRRLPFGEGSFAGYWSLGVIEHFYSGYDCLAEEIERVIQPGGYVFLTFPCMSPLRRLMARFGRYPRLRATNEPPGFYQFALEAGRVVADFERLGFHKRFQTSMSGLQGMKDELGPLGRPLQKLYAYSGASFFVRALRGVIDRLAPLGIGHACVLVLQKEANPARDHENRRQS